MLYARCPTCGMLLAHKVVEYEKEVDKINKNDALSKDERIKQRQDLLQRLDVYRYCCKMRFITYVDTVEFIK